MMIEPIGSFRTPNPRTIIQDMSIRQILVPGSGQYESTHVGVRRLDSRDDAVPKNVHMRHIEAL